MGRDPRSHFPSQVLIHLIALIRLCRFYRNTRQVPSKSKRAAKRSNIESKNCMPQSSFLTWDFHKFYWQYVPLLEYLERNSAAVFMSTNVTPKLSAKYLHLIADRIINLPPRENNVGLRGRNNYQIWNIYNLTLTFADNQYVGKYLASSHPLAKGMRSNKLRDKTFIMMLWSQLRESDIIASHRGSPCWSRFHVGRATKCRRKAIWVERVRPRYPSGHYDPPQVDHCN